MRATNTLTIEHIEAKPGTGTPRIAGKGVLVEFVAHLVETHGLAVDQICSEYDLTPGEVYAALSYYADHRDELDRAAREAQQQLEQRFADNPELDALRQEAIKRGQR